MSNDLRIGIIADASSLEGAMNDAAASVDALAARVQRASANMAQAQQEFGKAAAQGNATAQAALEDYAQELAAASAAQEAFAASAATATAAVDRVGASSRQAATAGIGILEGRMMSGNRAAASFLSTALGLGPALQAAFPVIGALALGEVVLDVGKGLAKFGENATDLSRELGVSWMAAAVGQMDGLKEAVAQADKELEQLAKDADTAREKIQALQNEQLSLTHGPAAGLRQQGDQKGESVKALQGGLGVLREEQRELQAVIDKAREAHQARQGAGAQAGHIEGELSEGAYAKTEELLKVATEQAKSFQQAIEAATLAQQNLYLQADKAQEKQDKAPKGKNPDQEALLADRTAFAERENLHHQILGSELVFWEQRIANYTHGSQQYLEVLERVNRLQAEFQKNISEPGKIKTELARREKEPAGFDTSGDLGAGLAKSQQEEAEKAARDHTASLERQAKLAEEQEQRRIKFNVQTGRISPHQGAQQQLAQVDQEEQTRLKPLNAEQSGINKNGSQQERDQWKKIEDEKTEVSQQASAKREQITQQEMLRQQQTYMQGFNTVSGAFNTLVDKWLTGSERMSKAFVQFGDQIALGFTNQLLRMGEKWLAHELLMTVQRQFGNEQRVASDVAAAAQAKSIQSATNVAEVISYAAVAGAAVAADYAVLGPEIALPAGAAMMAAITGTFAAPAAFASGTDYVPKTGLAMIHEGEAVVTRGTNSKYEQALDSGFSKKQGSQFNFHYSPNIQGIDGASVAGMAQKHSQVFNRQLMRQMRLKGLVQG